MVVVKGDIKRENGYLIPKNIHKNQDVEIRVTDIQTEEYGEYFSGEVKKVYDRDIINRNDYIILKIISNKYDGILSITSGGIVTHHPEGTGVGDSHPNTRIGRLERLEKI